MKPDFHAIAAVATLLAAVIAGCSTPPAPAPVQPSDGCDTLAAALADADDNRRIARERQENAWKTALPVLMVARYTQEKHAAQRAEVRMEQLRVEMDAQGCTP